MSESSTVPGALHPAPHPASPPQVHGDHTPHAPHAPHVAPVMRPSMPGQPAHAPAHVPGQMPRSVGIPTLGKPKDDLSSLSLVDGPPEAGASANKIRAFGVKEVTQEREFQRHSDLTGKCACHIKSFHGHLGDEGLRRLDDKINDWLENHTFAEVKFVTTTIGVWDGKTKDQAMIINIWY